MGNSSSSDKNKKLIQHDQNNLPDKYDQDDDMIEN